MHLLLVQSLLLLECIHHLWVVILLHLTGYHNLDIRPHQAQARPFHCRIMLHMLHRDYHPGIEWLRALQ